MEGNAIKMTLGTDFFIPIQIVRMVGGRVDDTVGEYNAYSIDIIFKCPPGFRITLYPADCLVQAGYEMHSPKHIRGFGEDFKRGVDDVVLLKKFMDIENLPLPFPGLYGSLEKINHALYHGYTNPSLSSNERLVDQPIIATYNREVFKPKISNSSSSFFD